MPSCKDLSHFWKFIFIWTCMHFFRYIILVHQKARIHEHIHGSLSIISMVALRVTSGWRMCIISDLQSPLILELILDGNVNDLVSIVFSIFGRLESSNGIDPQICKKDWESEWFLGLGQQTFSFWLVWRSYRVRHLFFHLLWFSMERYVRVSINTPFHSENCLWIIAEIKLKLKFGKMNRHDAILFAWMTG